MRNALLMFMDDTLNQLYARLNPNGGMLLFEADRETSQSPVFGRWLRAMENSEHDFESSSGHEDFLMGTANLRARVTRSLQSPTTLP